MRTIGIPLPVRRPVARLFGACAVVALAIAVPAAAGRAHDAMVTVAAENATVTIDHHAFAPAALTINAGTTVTWKNADDSPHTVRSRSQTFASGALDTGDSFSQTFATPGVYQYFCSLHPFMVGEIVVKPAGKSS
jgi:plastocyanin